MTLTIYPSSPVILDGGFGTTLEEVFKVDLSGTPLWSAQQILDSPETVINAHLAFLRSGARIILTATYQCSLDSFSRAGRTAAEYSTALIRAVELASEARARYRAENPDCPDIRIALSLGPYGANLAPAQEFTGFYPPPFGPKSYSADGENYNSFGSDLNAEKASIEALSKFHLDRLWIIFQQPQVYEQIDIIAFETIPLRRELLAIRAAIRDLSNLMRPASFDKPWWTTFTLQEGNCPETSQPEGVNLTVEDLVKATFDQDTFREGGELPVPNPIGINCTTPALIPRLAKAMTDASARYSTATRSKPWLVLYPNGGLYDPSTKTWKGEKGVHALETVLKRTYDEIEEKCLGVWGGMILGGCCGTGPSEIEKLKNAFEMDSRSR